ncbi:MAG TPA: hypothetical protein VFX48_09955 [Saprospiraceae bacterium]|nr:hypothetical protein [Saprospiraceae bacterium]
MKSLLSCSLGLALCCILATASAQNNENSPLSRYGLGDLRSGSTGWMSGMANSGTAFLSEQLYNPLNPASAAYLRQTDVELGIQVKRNYLEDGNGKTFEDWSGNLSHIFLAVPLRNAVNELLDRKTYKHSYALQLGLNPFSTVGYRSETVDSSDKANRLSRFLQGNGTIQALNLGFAYRYQNFAAGLQMNYLFGTLNYNQNLLFTSVPSSYDSYISDSYHITGWRPTLGFSYRAIINKQEVKKDNSVRKQFLSASLVFQLPTKFNASYSALHQTRFEEELRLVDTTFYVDGQKSEGTHPLGIRAGLYYSHKEKYGLMGSFQYDLWNDAKFPAGLIGTVGNSSLFQLGGWYKPGSSGFDKFFKKSIYRFGAYTGTDYREIQGEAPNLIGLTLGWSYPILFLRQDAMVHLSLDLGQRMREGLLTEKYIQIHFGVSINDNEWFLKRRYN